MATEKKITRIEVSEATSPRSSIQTNRQSPQPAVKARNKATLKITLKAKAFGYRLLAVIWWLLAITAGAAAIFWQLRLDPPNYLLVAGLLACEASLAVLGLLLWRSVLLDDPPQPGNKAEAFLKNHLGFLMAVLAFFPLIIWILTMQDIKRRQKVILTALTAIGLGFALMFGLSQAVPLAAGSTEQSEVVVSLMGVDEVYWTASGSKMHLYDDCAYINTSRTKEIFVGTVAAAYQDRHLDELCKPCYNRAQKAQPKAGD